jgi:hypothetical protein
MSKKINKPLIISISAVILVVIAIAIFFIVSSSQSIMSGSGYGDGSVSYSNGNIQISFTTQNNNPHLDINSCYTIGLIDGCRGVISGSTIMLNGVDESTCSSIGASWEKQSSARGCDGKACYLGNMNLNDYIIKDKSTDLIVFDLKNFQETKALTVCNNGNTAINSANINVILEKDYDETFFRLEGSQCSEITIKVSQKTDNDYESLNECRNNLPEEKAIFYHFENNECTEVSILPSTKTDLDYENLDDCKENITSYLIPVIAGSVIFIFIIGIIILGIYFKRK